MNFSKTGRSIIGIGRNYADHAKELANKVPTTPFYFLKPASSYLIQPAPIEIPKNSIVHHEIELGVIIGTSGRDITSENAMNHVSGYCLALDLTARDQQDLAKSKGYPWSQAKGYDTFTPVSSFIPKSEISDPNLLELCLKINGVVKQKGPTKDMIFKIPQLIEYVSAVMRLEEGDLILTGTPKGVGPIKPGDVLTGSLNVVGVDNKLTEFRFGVVERGQAV